MIDKFTIGILLLAFILSISMMIYEAGRIEDPKIKDTYTNEYDIF